MNKIVIIAGGTGFIGKHLTQCLKNKGYRVKILSRKAITDDEIYWDGKTLGDWVAELENSYALVNLTGRSLACRWNKKNWQEIYDSRIQTTSILGQAINVSKFPPKYWINVSGIHYYADTELPVNELSPNGTTRLAKFCREWENTMYALEHPDTKKIVLRIGFLLGKDDGAFPMLRKVTQYFLGGSIGSGKQAISWIHLDDLIQQFAWLIEKGDAGFYNGVSPTPISNKEFMFVLRHVGHRPWSPPLPNFLAPIVLSLLGFEPSLVIENHKVYPKRFINNGFQYIYDNLDVALKSLY